MNYCTYSDPHRPSTIRCTECGGTRNLCSCPNPSEAAHRRLFSPEGKTIEAIRQLLSSLEGSDFDHPLARLSSEVGQANLKFFFHDRQQDSTTSRDVYYSLIKVAAAAIRLAVEGDPDFSYEPSSIFDQET